MKKLIAVVLSSLLLIGAAVGGTLALASADEYSANVYTAGNIDIKLINGEDENLELFPAVYNFEISNPWELKDDLWKNIQNAHTKNIAVKNVGDSPAYVRVIIAYENPKLADGGNFYDLLVLNKISNTLVDEKVVAERIEIDGVDYKIVSYTFKDPIQPNTTSAVVLRQLALKTETTSEQMAAIGDNFNLLVCAQAVQVDAGNGPDAMLNAAFPNEHPWVAPNNPGTLVKTEKQLQDALNNGGTVALVENIAVTAPLTIPEGKTVTLNLNGQNITTDGTNAIYSEGDLKLVGEGKISSVSNYAIRVQKGSLVIDSANIEVSSEFGAVSVFNGANVTINGGNFFNKGYGANTSHTIYLGGYGTININGGTFDSGYSNGGIDTICGYGWSNAANEKAIININGGTFYPSELNSSNYFISNYNGSWTEINISGGTFHNYNPSTIGGVKVTAGYEVIDNADGTYTVDREYIAVTLPDGNDKVANGEALAGAINETTENAFLKLPAGEYKMPSINGNKEVTIVGTKDTVIDITLGAYMDSSKISFEGVTIKGSTGKANGNGSDYAALYTPNVTYTNCTFDGPFRIGRDGATFINCTFNNLGNDYVWTYGNDATFIGCTFNSDGKALLIYSDGGNEVSKVTVKNCVFNATQGAKAGAIANQNCAAIEIDNYGNGVDLTTEGNTYDTTYFSGEWRIKSYSAAKPAVIVDGATYTSIAIDGKTMTIDANKNVTVNG